MDNVGVADKQIHSRTKSSTQKPINSSKSKSQQTTELAMLSFNICIVLALAYRQVRFLEQALHPSRRH